MADKHTFATRSEYIASCEQWCKGFFNENKVFIVYVRKSSSTWCKVQIDGQTYYRRGRGTPKGVVVAYRGKDGVLRVGWSFCRNKEKYNRRIGLRAALSSAQPINYVPNQIDIAAIAGEKEIPSQVLNTLKNIWGRLPKAFPE